MVVPRHDEIVSAQLLILLQTHLLNDASAVEHFPMTLHLIALGNLISRAELERSERSAGTLHRQLQFAPKWTYRIFDNFRTGADGCSEYPLS